MNKVFPENSKLEEEKPQVLKTEEEEIQLPGIQIDPTENNIKHPKTTSSTKMNPSSHSKNNSYVDLINLETAHKPDNKNEENENNELLEKLLEESSKEKEIDFHKPEKSSIKSYEEKDSLISNDNGDSPKINSPTLEVGINKKRAMDKKRTMRLDSQCFLKKPLSAGISSQLPIDKLSLMIEKENERYISQCFEFKFGSDKNWLNVAISNDFLNSQENIEIKTYNINDDIPYKWELKDLYKHDEESCFFGKVYEAVDLNTNTKYSLKIVDYETFDLVVLHDFLYNILICRYLTILGGYDDVLKVHDLYIAENDNIFEGIKHHMLVVVMENAPLSLHHLINIRKQKQLKWKDEELLSYLMMFFEEMQKIYVNTGWCCEPSPQNIFYSLTSNSLKLCNFRKRSTKMPVHGEDLTWTSQIKILYATIQTMKSLNKENTLMTQKLKRSDSDVITKEEANKNSYSMNFNSLLMQKPDDYKTFLEKLKTFGLSESMKKSDEHLVYEIYYVNEKKDNTENMIKNFSFFSKKYENLLQFTQAFECYEKVIKYRQNDLEANEKSFLKIKFYMGFIFFQTGYFDEATTKLKEVNDILVSKYIEEYDMTVDIEIIFGMIDKHKKDIDSSIKHFETALQLLRKNGQLNTLKTSQILIYLGYLYDVFGLNLSQIKKAHRSYSEALNIRKLLLKNKYQNNLVQLINNLGIISHKLEKYDQSIEYFEEVLAIEQKSENRNRIANAKMNLGVIYQELQNYDEALKNFEEALEMHKSLGFLDENKDVLSIYNNIATIYQIQGKYAEAIKFYKDALMIKDKNATKSEEKTNLEILLNNLASIYYKAGFYEKSKQFYQKSLNLKRNNYGVDNPSIAFTLNNLGLVFEKLGQDQEALKHYEESLMIKKKFFSDKHISIGQTLTNLMYLCSKMGYIVTAIEYGRQALEIKRVHSGKDYLNLSAIGSFLGSLYETDKKFNESINMYNESLIYQRMVDDGSNEVGFIMQKIAELSEIMNENEKAIKIYDDCLNIFKLNLGLTNRNVGEIMCKIADIYHKIKADDIAKLYYEGAIKILSCLEEIDEELIQNIEDQTKKLKTTKNNKIFANNKILKLMEEIQTLKSPE